MLILVLSDPFHEFMEMIWYLSKALFFGWISDTFCVCVCDCPVWWSCTLSINRRQSWDKSSAAWKLWAPPPWSWTSLKAEPLKALWWRVSGVPFAVVSCARSVKCLQVRRMQIHEDVKEKEKKKKKKCALTWDNWPGMTVGCIELWEGENKRSKRTERRMERMKDVYLLLLLILLFFFLLFYLKVKLECVNLIVGLFLSPPGAGRH